MSYIFLSKNTKLFVQIEMLSKDRKLSLLMRQKNNKKKLVHIHVTLTRSYLLGNKDSYEGGKSLSAVLISAPLTTIVSGGAVAITAIVSKCGTGCISEECGWLLGWSIQQNAVPQCRNNHRNAINATNMVNRPATVPAKILVPNVVLKRSPFPSHLKNYNI